MKMKTLFFFSAALSLFSANAFAAKNYVEGEILVKYKTSMTISAQRNAIEREGHKRLGGLGRGISRVKLTSTQDMKRAIADFKSDPNVEFAQPNYIYKATALPNDPKLGQLWALRNTGQTIAKAGKDAPYSVNNPGMAGKDMRLEYAWNNITDCSSVIVAVLDTGVNYNHSDLAANMWDGGASYPYHGSNFIESNNDPMDTNGHGTHVAGTIGAVGNNGVGGVGVCWRAKLMAVRVLDTMGSGTTSSLINGIYFAVDNGAKVLNMSLGGDSYDALYSAAIDYAQTHGALIVAAAGNEGTNNESVASYPCNFPQDNVICVAALTQTYALASFSNYGTTSVDVGAPGVNIFSNWPGTHTTISDPLTGGWTFTSSQNSPWGFKQVPFELNNGQTIMPQSLVNPRNYDYFGTGRYVNNNDARAWKSFYIGPSIKAAVMNYYVAADLEDNADFVTIHAKAGSSEPFTGGGLIDSYTGSTNGSAYYMEYDVSNYISSNISIGYKFLSNATGVDKGTVFFYFNLETLSLNNTSYNVISGTSMAAPNVAGVAAMVFAFNPNYSYSEVANAVKYGGTTTTSLMGKTVTGKAVSAIGSLNYIKAPLGGAAVILP